MNRELKAKWVAALRSGNYEQGYSRLKRTSGGVAQYCCLGVLCEVAKDDYPIHQTTNGTGLTRFGDSKNGISSQIENGISSHALFLPPVFVRTIALHPVQERRLADLNDKEKATFPEIADWIEENINEE